MADWFALYRTEIACKRVVERMFAGIWIDPFQEIER